MPIETKENRYTSPGPQRHGVTASLVRRLNRSAVLDLFRTGKPISRAEIARSLHMSLPTAMRIVDVLLEEDLIRPCGSTEASGGRPRPLLQFNSDGYVVIGVDMGGARMYGTSANLAGEIQNEIQIPIDGPNPKESLARLIDLVQRLIDTPRPSGQRLRGLCIGAPGVTRSEEGIVTWAPSLGWRELPLKSILSQRFSLPVIVENDVNLATLGEYGFGAGQGVSTLVNISLGTGVGAGIVINRSIYRGFHQSAGEIGYLLPGVQFLNKSYGGFGALESMTSLSGIARRARALLKEKGIPVADDGPEIEEVFAAARRNEVWAMQVVAETIDYLSLAIASVSALLDPEMIVLSGSLTQAADLLIEPIRHRLQDAIPALPAIVPSTFGYRASVMGAIMLVLDATTEYVSLVRQPQI